MEFHKILVNNFESWFGNLSWSEDPLLIVQANYLWKSKLEWELIYIYTHIYLTTTLEICAFEFATWCVSLHMQLQHDLHLNTSHKIICKMRICMILKQIQRSDFYIPCKERDFTFPSLYNYFLFLTSNFETWNANLHDSQMKYFSSWSNCQTCTWLLDRKRVVDFPFMNSASHSILKLGMRISAILKVNCMKQFPNFQADPIVGYVWTYYNRAAKLSFKVANSGWRNFWGIIVQDLSVSKFTCRPLLAFLSWMGYILYILLNRLVTFPKSWTSSSYFVFVKHKR